MKITELIDFHFFIQEAKLKYTLTKFCQTNDKVGKQEKAKPKKVKLPTSKAEILRDYRWSTNSNMYVNKKTGVPSPEITSLYNRFVAEEHAPQKNPYLDFYTQMLQTGKHPITGEAITSAERTNAEIMTWGLALQPFVGAVAASKLPQGKTSSGSKTSSLKKDYKYSHNVIEKAKADPLYHDFPKSLDSDILSNPLMTRADGRIEHLARGAVNGEKGIYHITVKGDSIIHRTFIPESDWARFSKVNQLLDLLNIPSLK